MTRLEVGIPDDIGATTVMSVEPKKKSVPPSSGNVIPGGAKPPDPTATLPPPPPAGASNPRIVRPNPTVTPGNVPPPIPPKKG
ncbi:MAG: hypothetical protein ACOZNI_02070 [Myxococcota bacterium]